MLKGDGSPFAVEPDTVVEDWSTGATLSSCEVIVLCILARSTTGRDDKKYLALP